MPDDADWDPADSRYNTIRWIIQPGGGYAVGPSHANPYTGEIYAADVRISVDFLRFFFTEFEEFVNPQSWMDGLESARWDEQTFEEDNFARGLSQQMAFGWNVLYSRGLFGIGKDDMKDFVDEGITSLVVHEVGHTLGLRHNFKASTIYTSEQLSINNNQQVEQVNITNTNNINNITKVTEVERVIKTTTLLNEIVNPADLTSINNKIDNLASQINNRINYSTPSYSPVSIPSSGLQVSRSCLAIKFKCNRFRSYWRFIRSYWKCQLWQSI